ncbi:MAG TPA: ferric reductase-like transmembrane domain-containing protein, partial [Acidimicrobiales bacterium]|nr:ferric reductase-like transmembrane domain-containing protein [Acidimicrobiales bacterium]
MATTLRAPALRPTAPPVTVDARRDRARDVGTVVIANAVVVVGLWLRHGGPALLGTPGGAATAVGQLTGLLGAYVVLIELLLMSRIAWLERSIGFDRLAVWHRWTGFAAVTLLTSHVVFITLGYAASSGQTIVAQTVDFVKHYPDVLMSIVGFALFLAVAITSARAARRRMTREAWYAVHLYAYLAVALSFAHQLAVGTDFSGDRLARVWWIALYLAVFGAIVAWRLARPLWFNARHRLRIHSVRREANGVVSIYLTGARLADMNVAAGQFFLWRFLT